MSELGNFEEVKIRENDRCEKHGQRLQVMVRTDMEKIYIVGWCPVCNYKEEYTRDYHARKDRKERRRNG